MHVRGWAFLVIVVGRVASDYDDCAEGAVGGVEGDLDAREPLRSIATLSFFAPPHSVARASLARVTVAGLVRIAANCHRSLRRGLTLQCRRPEERLERR